MRTRKYLRKRSMIKFSNARIDRKKKYACKDSNVKRNTRRRNVSYRKHGGANVDPTIIGVGVGFGALCIGAAIAYNFLNKNKIDPQIVGEQIVGEQTDGQQIVDRNLLTPSVVSSNEAKKVKITLSQKKNKLTSILNKLVMDENAITDIIKEYGDDETKLDKQIEEYKKLLRNGEKKMPLLL